jgi:hypothetical protein
MLHGYWDENFAFVMTNARCFYNVKGFVTFVKMTAADPGKEDILNIFEWLRKKKIVK